MYFYNKKVIVNVFIETLGITVPVLVEIKFTAKDSFEADVKMILAKKMAKETAGVIVSKIFNLDIEN